MRSKSESKYRAKIIQELHLKKLNQIWLDNYCKDISYKDFYLSGIKPPAINYLIISMMNMKKAIKRLVNVIMSAVTEELNKFAQVVSEVTRC
jgi:hypothetical protein